MINMLASESRLALVLGLPPDLRGIALVKAWRESIKGEFKPVPPVEVKGNSGIRSNLST